MRRPYKRPGAAADPTGDQQRPRGGGKRRRAREAAIVSRRSIIPTVRGLQRLGVTPARNVGVREYQRVLIDSIEARLNQIFNPGYKIHHRRLRPLIREILRAGGQPLVRQIHHGGRS